MSTSSMTNRRILIIDDNPAIFDDFRKVLATPAVPTALADLEASIFGEPSQGAAAPPPPPVVYELDYAQQGQEGLAKLIAARAEGRPYALAFVDMRMPPGWDGVETIRHLWAEDRDLQIVIATAYSDYSPDEISKAVGLSDQILLLRKPFETAEVRQLAATMTDKWRVNRQRGELEAIVQERTAELRRAALTDGLTGLPNRTLFNDRLNAALKRATRDPEFKFVVLFLDCDRFKVVNDSLGHDAGDQLLLNVADRLTRTLREVDTVARPADAQPVTARLGGDEFAILLDQVRSDCDAARVADRLIATLAAPHTISGREIHSSASIGITTSTLGYTRAEDMVRDADTAMYGAKRAGGSRYVMFDREMHIHSVERLTLETDLRNAMARDQFLLHYQPIVTMRNRQTTGFEALLRWQHPTRGLISPTTFIPIAEETGIIVPLGLWVLRQACQQLAAWQAGNPSLATLTMSVNLSRKQIGANDLVAAVRDVLQETGVAPQNLKLEITESAIMGDVSTAIRVFRELQALGVQLHMDDFGTGHSSLSCLQQFPLNGLKIDRDFVARATGRQEDAAIVRAIIALAHNLKIPLVAEGIETPEQITLLESLGCDHAQGYFFARPMDAESATTFVNGESIAAVAA
ncbi:MAG TPA: EAL domain-containing protein [Tepidisphaeraceae bacterium]|jgi:diguanylate cyclase (GGDEF)-like protein|nr:EAL domain-containing protein [Tepidisphaeraceae bacterium]